MYKQFSKYKYEKRPAGSHVEYSDGINFYEGQQEYVRVCASADEIRRVHETCEACCKIKRGYNYSDKALSVLLLAPILADDVDIFTATTLHNAQAVLLILRCALDPGNALRGPLMALNSRAVYSTQLYRALSSFI